MAERLNEQPDWSHPRSREHLGYWIRYPLDEWLDGAVWKLEAGTDFHEPVHNFRTSLYYHATENGQRLHTKTRTEEGRTYLLIQAIADPSLADRPARKRSRK
jgi:hypothetical protein